MSRGDTATTGRYVSFDEREDIALLWAQGWHKAEIARRVHRHPSTIGRELARNGGRVDYRASTAQRTAEDRARRPKTGKLAADPQLRQGVQDKLHRRWSPEQIARRLAGDHPDQPEKRVSHETIYQALYVQGKGTLKRELAQCLRTGRAVRKPHRMPDQRRHRPGRIPDMVTISERPPEVADRAVPGHWEGDLIVGKDSASAIGTLVERSTRFCMLLHLPNGKSAPAVAAEMIRTVHTLPEHLRRTLTWDQGGEMACHADITLATNMDIYFCDPHSPWQRGTNENTNGLLRQFFPKGTNLSHHTRTDLDHVADLLNGRPRKP